MDLKFYSTKRVLLSALFLMAFSLFSIGQTNTYTGASGGNWSTPGNWSLSHAPLLAEDVVITNGRNVTLDAATMSCNSLTINGGVAGTALTISGSNVLTITGALIILAPTAAGFLNTFDVSSGVLNVGSVALSDSGSNTMDCSVQVRASGILNCNGNFTQGGASNENTLRLNGGSTVTKATINIKGNFIPSGTGPGDLRTNGHSVFNLNGTSPQILSMNPAFQYGEITINNTAGVTLSAAMTAAIVRGSVTVQTGFLDSGGFAMVGRSTNITSGANTTFAVANGATFKMSGATAAYPSGFINYTCGATSIVEYNGTGGQTVFSVATPGYGFLNVNNNSTKTVGAGLFVQADVTVGTTATLAMTTFTHAITGNVSNSGTITATSGIINVTGNWTNNASPLGTFNGGTTSTLSVTGNMSNAGTITAGTGASNINVKGNWSNTGTFTCGTTGTVTFTSTATGKTLTGTLTGATGTFRNLIFNGVGGGWTVGNTLGVASAMTITNGTVNNGGFAIVGATTLTMAAGTKLEIDGTTSSFPSGFTTNTLNATSTVEYKGSGNQTVFNVAAPGYGHLISNNAIKTAQGNLAIQGNFSIQSGTFDNGGFSITGTGAGAFALSNAATLQLSGTTSAFPASFASNTCGATSTVEYKGTGIQTVFDVASPGYGHLTITNNSTKTMAASALDIQGNVTINSTATLAATAFTHNVGGNWTNSGTFTSSTSTINFTSTSTGKTISGTLSGASGRFNNLTFNGVGGGWTLGANTDVAANMTITNGTVNNGGFAIVGTTTLSMAAGTKLEIDGTTSSFPSGFTTNTLNATSTVEYKGSGAQTVFDVVSPGYGHLTINNGTKTAASALDIQGNLAIQSGTFDNGGFAVVGVGNTLSVSNGATLKLSGTTSAFPSGFTSTTCGATSTVNYAGSGAQTLFDVASPGYGNLTISGNALKSTPSALDLQGDFNIQTGTVNNGGFAIACSGASKTFTLANGATLQLAGTTSAFPSGFTTSTLGTTSTVEYKGTGVQSVFDVPSPGYGNLTFDGVGGSWTISADIDVANLLTANNGTVTMNNTFAVAGNGPLTVGSGATFTLNNNACLIQSGYSGSNSGNIKANKNSSPIIQFDYTYWSSPTNGSQTLSNFSPLTLGDKFFTYHNSWTYSNPSSTTFTPGVGYCIRNPQGISPSLPALSTQQFTGVPNNGNIDVPVTYDGSLGHLCNRLIGNPYPSTLDADAFIAANVTGTGTINQSISGTLYFWTHNHSLTGNNYASSDYATYTLLGGTAVATGTGNTTAPTKNIATGQGFFVHTIATGNVSFRNSMRLGTNNTNFYRTKSGSNSRSFLEVHRLWVNLTNTTSSFSQILVGYVETATNGVDPGFDGLYYGDDQHVLYSLIGDGKYTINARALPFVNTDFVPLGYRTNVAGETTLTLDHVDGLFLSGQKIYLNDTKTNTIHCISDSPYKFSSEVGEFNDRFVLQYVDYALSNEDFKKFNEDVIITTTKNHIQINSFETDIKNVSVYDILGRIVYENNGLNSKEITISEAISNQTLIVKIKLMDGSQVTKKIIK